MIDETIPWEDPIVKKVRDIRENIAAEHHHNLNELCDYLRSLEQRETRKLVTRPPRRPHPPKRATR